MSIYGATYRVQFDRVDLGSDVVSDEYMAVHGDLEVMGPFRRGQRTAGVCECMLLFAYCVEYNILVGHDNAITADDAERKDEEDASPTEVVSRSHIAIL